MRKRFPNLMRLMVVLAMVSSLVAVTVAPASANVTAATVTPAPATAGDAASYTVAFNVGSSGALTAATHTISITFPSAVTLPTSIDKLQVTVNGTVLASDPTVSGQTVSLITPVGVANSAAVSVVISQVAGITNPAVAYTAASSAYKVSVYTSVESTAVNSNAFEILPSYSISPTSGDRFDSVTVTGKGWTASGGITIGGGLTGTGTADASGAFTLTASPNGNGGAVTITDGAGQTQASPWVGTVTQPSYTLKGRVIVSPTSGLVGSTVAVLGYDFTSGGNVSANSITMGGTTLTHSQYILTTRDAYGTLDDAYVSVAVPANMTGGAKTVSVTDGTKTATATFTVSTPTVTLSPTSGAPNTMVTITGSNFGANQSIGIGQLTFAGEAWNTIVIPVDSSGGWTYSIKAPAAAVSGVNPVVATSTAGTTASTTFTVSARTLTLTPSSGPSGTKVTVSGANMTANGTIGTSSPSWVTFAGAGWNTAAISIDSLGNISPTTLTVPGSSGTGSNTVAAVDSGGLSASGTFTVTQPTIEISPSSGYKGDTITVTGAGWVPGTLGLVAVTFNAVTQVVATPDADGGFTAQFTVPLTAVSGQLVGASDTLYLNAAAPKAFLIDDPTISIDPTGGAVGTEVTLTGAGFQPQSAVTALSIGAGSVLPTTAIITDTLGAFSATFTVPGLGTGAQTVSATVYGLTATTFFTISTAPVTVATALSGISSQLVRVWGYSAGAWQMYDPADPTGSDLTGLTAGRGYWVNVTEDVTLVYGGNTYDLTTGWNLIGWQG